MSDELNFEPSHDELVAPAGYRRSVGIWIVGLNDNSHNRFGMPQDEGVVIRKVLPNSAAFYAGAREGDVILKIDGRALSSLPGSNVDLLSAVRKYLTETAENNAAIVLLVRRAFDELTLKLVF